MECFQKNPTLRISAKRLLKHPWIMSAKRTVPAVPTKPTEYTEAVKSVQEWNEALKSPNSLRRSARLASGAPKSSPTAANGAAAPSRKAAVNVNLNIPKQRPNADSFRSPELDRDDNWDDDFAESISPRALQMPHLKPQDNFAGLFSSDKLKAFASFESVTEQAEYGDGEATVKSPLNLQHFQKMPQGFMPRANGSTKANDAKARANILSSRATSNATKLEETQDIQPKTAFLRGIPKAAQIPKSKVAGLARPSQLFREDSFEDYSDLLPSDEGAFERKLAAMQYAQPPGMLPKVQIAHVASSSPSDSFSPRLFHPSDVRSGPKSTRDRSNGNVRQRSASSTSTRKLQRTQSEIEIQKYAEDEGDDFSDVFGDIRHHNDSSRAESDSGSEHSSLAMITSKMANSFVIADEDDMDPFANLDEGLDNLNLENNVARDRDDRLTKMTEALVGDLKTSQPDNELLDIADQLIQILNESPDKRLIILRSHGMLPILEILGSDPFPPNELVLPLLRIINLIILEDAEAQESLSFLGGIPTICHFASKKYPSDIRKEAAAFVRQMYQTSTLTLQMFIGCGGINVLVEFLEEDIDAERDLVLIGVNGVYGVFELQGPTPKNDFCRIFSRSSVLYPLSLVLNRMVEEDGEVARLIVGRIVHIFLVFSQAESHVKDLVADRMILKRKSCL